VTLKPLDRLLTFAPLLLLALLGACKLFGGFRPEALPLPKPLANYEPMQTPADNPLTAEKAALGKQLFFDERLSTDASRSCYSCHRCENGLSDGLPTAIGSFNRPLARNSPTLWNIGYLKEFCRDGRSASLELQAMEEWTGVSMAANANAIAAKLNTLEQYRAQFQHIFGRDASPDDVVKAIASFERTLISGDTAWDRWRAGDQTAITRSAWRGWNIFQGIKCNNCHDGVLFTDQQYHNIGVGMDHKEIDLGRFKISNLPKDTGAFKTPTLRDVARSAPYFHDGSVATLEEAVDIMLAGGKPNPYLDRNLTKHDLLPEQREDVLNFLRSLTVDCRMTKPVLPEK
jgi:cytochrome c peroxidase